jgi:hypothetical protein
MSSLRYHFHFTLFHLHCPSLCFYHCLHLCDVMYFQLHFVGSCSSFATLVKISQNVTSSFTTRFGNITSTRPNFNYFGHCHNYDATIRNFILLVGSILHLFSSINRLICPINCNNHQISCILKVFYNDIGVYFNVCTKIIYIYIICIHIYIEFI